MIYLQLTVLNLTFLISSQKALTSSHYHKANYNKQINETPDKHFTHPTHLLSNTLMQTLSENCYLLMQKYQLVPDFMQI